MSYDDLARTLRTYGFQPDAKALKSAFSQGPEASEWVRRHLLSPETLLTRDELDQYAALVKSGAADRLSCHLEKEGRQSSSAPHQQRPRVVTAAGDSDLRTAIDELNRATAAVTRQNEALRQQHDALERLVAQDVRAADVRAKSVAGRARHAAAERGRLAAEAESFSQTLSRRVAEFEGRRNRGPGGLQQVVDGLLRSDDKLLASLQKLGWELEAEDPKEREGVVKARETCARLIKYTVETVRTKLDRLYLEALEEEDAKPGSTPDSQRRRQVSSDEISEMQAELEELYSEILPVAQMSVEQQFLEPAVQSLASRSASNLSRSVEALDYVDACLDYLLHNMITLSSRVQDYKAHESATAAVLSTAKSELSSQITTVTSSKAHSRTTSLPASASPVRHRRANTTSGIISDRNSTDQQDQEPALQTLLRTLALTLPDDPSKDAAALSTALRDRTAKAADMARNVQASFEGATAAHMLDSAAAVASLRDSVLAETTTAPTPTAEGPVVALTDPETESFIWVLQQEVARVRGRLVDVEAEIRTREAGGAARSRGGTAGQLGGGKREELIRRWGSAR